MNDQQGFNATPIVHWVSAVLAPAERFEIDALDKELSLGKYDSFEGFLSKYDSTSGGCVAVILCDPFLAEFRNGLGEKDQLSGLSV
jgi:hypothetical protein